MLWLCFNLLVPCLCLFGLSLNKSFHFFLCSLQLSFDLLSQCSGLLPTARSWHDALVDHLSIKVVRNSI